MSSSYTFFVSSIYFSDAGLSRDQLYLCLVDYWLEMTIQSARALDSGTGSWSKYPAVFSALALAPTKTLH